MITEEIKKISERLSLALSPIQIWLFGSFAKNTANSDSDYDFYVVMPDNSGDHIALLQKAYKSLRGLKRRSVDIVLGYESKFKKSVQEPTLENEVFKEGVLLYAK